MREFTKKLAEFFKEKLKASDNFCLKIENCENFDDIEICLEESKELKELICKDMQQKIDELEKEKEELEEEKEDLERGIKDLEDEMSEMDEELEKKFNPITYWDEERYNLFLKHHENFSPIEFEELLTKSKK